MRTFWVLMQKEFIQIRRNKFMIHLISIFPFVIMLIMPLVMTLDVRNVDVAVVDFDRSSTSKRIIAHIEASEALSLICSTSEYELAMARLEGGEIDVIVQIPKNFERDIAVSTPKNINITANAVNATKASLGSQYIVQTIASAIKELRAEKSPTPISDLVVVQNRFNPTLNYKFYMIPALMIILFILVAGFMPALSIVNEKAIGTIEQINVTPVHRWTFTLSKLVPYWIIGLLVLALAMTVAYLLYGLKPVGSVGLIYLGTALFILTISGFALTIANFSDTLQQTMFAMFFFIMIFILMGDLLTPIDSMPDWAQTFTYALPSRYFVNVLRSIYLRGSTFIDLWKDFVALGSFAIIFNALAALTYKKQN